ncbi:MAG: tetratricopeptide repeat protein [Melioribacteraceae bacterium]|nr:tetratricopeptide repeat protein [Melioribacteraceae bacterium]
MPVRSTFFLFICITFISFTNQLYAQDTKGLKSQANIHINAGRFGEAIDLLNKVISAEPREAEGYHLRGICFENRSQYFSSVIDLRRANKLNPENNTIKKDLARVTETWFAQLRRKIKGHQREIAIDPAVPVNYLEIGKSHRYLEEWDLAEIWYDKYLERDENASPDEIIRYSEILAKNKHIKKGETILKEWSDKYPDDWRLLSKYGYFTMWMGKRRNAETAFNRALEIKPFFKEAMDGLELAQRKPYVTQLDNDDVDKEYPIDRYYRLVKRNPARNDYRYKLIDELMKANRLTEAYQQILVLRKTEEGEERFEKKYEQIVSLRGGSNQKNLDRALSELEKDSSNANAVKEIAHFYELMENYNDALDLLQNFIEKYPDKRDNEILYQYARLSAWNKDYDSANESIDLLLEENPDNLKYKLFKAQLLTWNKENLETAEKYLQQVLENQPHNLEAIIAMSSLSLANDDITMAKGYADKAKAIDPENTSVTQLYSNIDFYYEVLKERKIYAELERARILFLDGNCEEAIEVYRGYIENSEPNEIVQKEFADAHFCAKKYDEALLIYDDILTSNYNPEIATQRAKVLYTMGDSVRAVQAFSEIVKENPEDFQANLYLGDALIKLGKTDSATAVYDSLLTWELDSTEISLIEQRKKWIPASGLSGIFESFPYYAGLQPTVGFYSDNLNFKFIYAGSRLELGFSKLLTFGVSFLKYYVKGSSKLSTIQKDVNTEFTSFKGSIFLRFSDKLTAGTSFGQITPRGLEYKNELDLFVNYDLSKKFNAGFSYSSSDAAILLYSPYLITTRLDADIYKFESFYETKGGIKFSGQYQYLSVSDKNKGEDLKLRVGKRFLYDLVAGYEYNYANWKYNSEFYYTPTGGFESHSAWADWEVEKEDDYKIFIGGRLGYIPSADEDSIIREIYGEGKYYLINKLSLVARMTLGSTYRFDTSYNYVSGSISAYWSF